MGNAPVQKPSLWRNLLAGALTGFGVGMSGAKPEQIAPLTLGAMQQREENQMRQQMLSGAEQREQRRLALDEHRAVMESERVQFERERLSLLTRQAEEQSALSMLNKLRLEKELSQMDSEEQRKWELTQSQYVNALANAGARIRFVTDDSAASVTAALQELGAETEKTVPGPYDNLGHPTAPQTVRENQLLQSVFPVHDRANNRILWFEQDSGKVYPRDTAPIVLPNGKKIEVAGRPINLIDAQLHLESAFGVAQINAAAREQAISSLLGNADLAAISRTHGDEMLVNLDPTKAAFIKGVANYEIDPSKLSYRGGQRELAIALAKQYDPSYDQTQYNARSRLRQDFTSGKGAVNIRSLNTAVAHLDTLSKAADELQNSGTPLWNKVANTGLSAVGDPRVVRFNTAATAVESELASVFKGMGATDQEIKVWRENLNSSQSPQQLKAAVNQAIELMAGRLDALRSQWETGMGKPANFHVLNDASVGILRRLGHDDVVRRDLIATPQAAQPAQSQLPPQALAQLKEGQATVFANGQAWTLQNGQPVRLK